MKPEDLATVKGARIQVIIQEDTRIGQFNSALYYSFRELDTMTAEDIEAERTKRTNGWVTFVETESAKVPVEPTKEELEERKVQMIQQKGWMESIIAELSIAIASKG